MTQKMLPSCTPRTRKSPPPRRRSSSTRPLALALAAALALDSVSGLVPNKLASPPRSAQLFASIRAPFDTPRAANYAVCARRAIDDGAFDKARASYEAGA